MKSDARVRYTKMVIKNSFVQLLAKKSLTKVTVKEICELSEINRATFYKYYCDPYDLLEKLENEFLKELENNVSQWLENGMTEPVSEVADFANRLVQSVFATLKRENKE